MRPEDAATRMLTSNDNSWRTLRSVLRIRAHKCGAKSQEERDNAMWLATYKVASRWKEANEVPLLQFLMMYAKHHVPLQMDLPDPDKWYRPVGLLTIVEEDNLCQPGTEDEDEGEDLSAVMTAYGRLRRDHPKQAAVLALQVHGFSKQEIANAGPLEFKDITKLILLGRRYLRDYI